MDASRVCRTTTRFTLASALTLGGAGLVWWLASPAAGRAWAAANGRQPAAGWTLDALVESALAVAALVACGVAIAVVVATLARELAVAALPRRTDQIPTVGPPRLRRMILAAFGIGLAMPAMLTAAAADGPDVADAPSPSLQSVDGLQLPDLPVPVHADHPSAQTVVVRTGDSLWSISADRARADATNARIASMVADLYTANRDVIGDDPNVITAGTVLTLPGGHHDRDK